MDAQELRNYIVEKRPTLSQSSVNTYASILRSLHKGAFGTADVDPDNFQKTEIILEFLKDVPPSKRKTKLSGLVILTDSKEFRDLMMSDIKSYKDTMAQNEMSDAQRAAWVTGDDIKKTYSDLEKDANMLFRKESLSQAELQRIQNYVILAVLGGLFIPVRRNKDYVDFKIRNIDKEKDNYLEKNRFVFNSYKTAKSYGQQKITIPKKLQTIIKKWIKVIPNESDYLLFDTNNKGFGEGNGSVKLNQRLQRIFGKKVGVNGLRHSSLTEKFLPVVQQKTEIEETMRDMGTSPEMLDTYVKTT
tara:strand:- start:2777 stop:3682 length:906 start_codon:yes stop_codon:yes gene_type:complete